MRRLRRAPAVRTGTRGGTPRWPSSKWPTCLPGSTPPPTTPTTRAMSHRVETRGRARALQALYAWDVRGNTDLLHTAEVVWDDLAVPPDERAFASALIHGIAASLGDLDASLREVTTNWRLE